MLKNPDLSFTATAIGKFTSASKVWFESVFLTCCLLVVFIPMTASNAHGRWQEEEAVGALEVDFGGAVPPMNRQRMEEYMYGLLGGSKLAFHKLKRDSIRRELDRVNSICALSDEQWGKLNEAIELEIQHIENRITSLLSGNEGKMTPQKLQEIEQNVRQFASTIQSEKSDKNAVWRKVLNSQLTQEQAELIKLDEAKKLLNLERTAQLKNLLSLQRKLGLNANQRVTLDEWLTQTSNRGLDFQSLCRRLLHSPVGKEILTPAQLKSLETPAVRVPMPLHRVLPAMDDLFR